MADKARGSQYFDVIGIIQGDKKIVMHFKVINKQILAEQVKRIDILAEDIARRVRPGQFVSVCAEKNDDHIPLTVTSSDPGRGSISLIFPEVGPATKKLGSMPINESLFSVLGPLGRPVTVEKKGVVVCVASGIGIAQILPICRAYKDAGNKVIGIIGAKTKKLLMLEAQLRLGCDKLFIATDDGSYERRGMATDILGEFLGRNSVNLIYVIGSVDLMRCVCSTTKERKIKTLVRLNPMMTDCMGMCGSCRVKVGGKTMLACVDGPEFNGHKVDFTDLDIRMKAYEESEGWSNRQSELKSVRNGSKTLTKFLSGILKN